jgi:hypothetical protein
MLTPFAKAHCANRGSLPAFLQVDEAGELTIIITQMLIFCGVANVTDPSARA